MAARDSDQNLTRRAFLAEGAGAVAAGSFVGGLAPRRRAWMRGPRAPLDEPRSGQVAALRALGRSRLRVPDSLPNPALPAGADTLPEIEHVVVLMMENHSYDNLLGMLGRGRGRRPRGDGFTLAADGYPDATNPYADGRRQRAFRMPTTCQLHAKPSQEWAQSHVQWAGGSNDGFVVSDSGPVAMGYWTGQDLPFTYDLASKFPIGDRWFCSLLGQTDPNRRFLIAATAMGMTDDIGGSLGNLIPDASLVLPSAGTIFERLDLAGLGWIDYYTSWPTGATVELYPVLDTGSALVHAKPIARFFADARTGGLPAFSLLDPDYSTQSQENPQNLVVGEAFIAKVVSALGASPAWRRTLLIITYDEHGGYYDHVPPPPALAPDIIPPLVQIGESAYDGYARYGFRVPAIVVGPYARRNHVSHVLYDHTSILAFLERKWNLPAMTYRDANANDLLDFLDLEAMAARQPTFPELPALAASGESAATLVCSRTGPGTIPPPWPPAASPPTPRVELRDRGISHREAGLVLDLRCASGSLNHVVAELRRRGHVVASRRIARLGAREHRVVLRVHGHPPGPGRYEVVVRRGPEVLVRRRLRIG